TPRAGVPANRQFDISFTPQSALGAYRMVIGPTILDVDGHPMDQNHNGMAGEDGVAPDGDKYAATFNIAAPRIIDQSVRGNDNLPGAMISSLQATFNEQMNAATFTPDKIQSFNGPTGPIAITGVTPVAGSNNTRFNITFAPLTATGSYRMVIGPDIQDLLGN